MGLKYHQMDAETPAGGRDRSEDYTRERGGRFTKGSLAGLDQGGLCPFHHDVGLGKPMTSPRSPMMLSDIFRCFGGSCVPSGMCGRFLRPKEA
jgi:hypothetical protein